jgi:hypothetical protein
MFHARQYDMSMGPADWEAEIVVQTLMPPHQAPGQGSDPLRGALTAQAEGAPAVADPQPPLHRSGNRSYTKLSVNNERR